MAPGRKRGANNKAKTSAEFSLGDLVLAKVKGFPAWPAKVSRSEDWGRASDPKKYFIQFFGTQEIAFVAPADVYAFTSESKSRLLVKCRGRTIKYFPQAVNEICEAFELLQQYELDGSRMNVDAVGPRSYASDVEQGKFKESHTEVKRFDCEGLNRSNNVDESGSLLEACPSMEDMSRCERDKHGATVEESGGVPDCQAFNKSMRDGFHKESGVTVSSPVVASSIKEEINSTENKLDRIHSSRASSSSPYGCRPDAELNTPSGKAGKKEKSISSGVSSRGKIPAPADRKATNGQKSNNVTVGSKRKHEGVVRHIDDGKSSMDRIPAKAESSVNGKLVSPGTNKSELNSVRKITKTQMKGQKHLDTGKSSLNEVIACSKDRRDGDLSKQNSGAISQEQSHSAKKAKHMDAISDPTKGSIIKNEKNVESGPGGDEAFLPLAKRNQRALEGMSDVSVPSEEKKMHCPSSYRNDVPKKRRAVRLYDEDDEVPKTPVHGRSLSSFKVCSAVIPESTRSTDGSHDVSDCHGENLKCSSVDMTMEDCRLPSKLVSESSIAGTLLDKIDISMTAEASHSSRIENFDNRPSKDTNLDLISPLKSPVMASANKLLDQQKSNMPPGKGSAAGSHSKAHNGSLKGPNLVSGARNLLQSQISVRRSRQLLSGEKHKGTPKLTLKNEPAAALDSQRDHGSMQGGSSNRLEDAVDKSGSLVDPKAGESSLSIKHLIAAAQARRREAHLQNVPLGNGDSVVARTNIHRVRSPSPFSGDQTFQKSGVDNSMQPDAVRAHSRGSVASPSSLIHNLTSQSQLESEEPEERRLSSTRQAVGGTLSGGTEAAVARDAFEGMIETLSRTKDSIGRATRLAIDCAKYGIANEVVDLLIRKLENEASFHRRVDLFFLVDSITQCSHSQKGIAGASYIPIVQAALPRLLGAAAPSGASARENRRQCLKVLRLWLQRKILPELVLKRHMDDIGGTNDNIASGLSLRRPSRAERSVDDPIREMEGMLVDEYGSNSMFNLPGFLHSRGFVDEEDEDDIPATTCKESDASPLELLNSLTEAEASIVSPIDRQHRILEDVDGELEMEDVSGHLKDGAQSPGGSPENGKQETYSNTGLESPTDDVLEPLSPEGSPPMPLEPLPPLPPLPSSPYPPPPPPLSPSPPPPPPPSSTSQPPPPPLLMSQPLPPPYLLSESPTPPSFLSHLPPPSLLPSGPPQPGHFQPMLAQLPSATHQVLRQPPSVHPPIQAPLPPDYSIPNGTQPAQMTGNSSQPVPCFTPAGSSGSRDLSGYGSRPFKYGQNDMFPGPQAGQPNKQFQPNQLFQPAFAQRSFPPIPVPQPSSSNFTYNKPAVQQHTPNKNRPPSAHPPPPLPPPSHLYSASQVHWRSASAFVGEAYFRPPERPLLNNVGYQVSASNPSLAGPSTQGHGINQMLPQMLPPMPDMSSLNCWRPI